ncbi:glycosyltransferase family 1 protein [Salinactinospora qingdaonensis]|uniref:glycogen phosphorylase n=1 Tax=Salinactinospora qingdaonensis TaxID=702744 RepID=A0ABP7GLQ0_9ACTN
METLAANLRWSWHPATRAIFAEVDPDVWEAVHHDPTQLLGEVTNERLAQLAADTDFCTRLRAVADDLDQYLREPQWYQYLPEEPERTLPQSIAYFSAEYGLTAALPQYSGGLGILAGDHLKSASDLGVPIIGVGLLYRHGYFSQSLSPEGWQLEHYPEIDPRGLPMTLLAETNGDPVGIVLDLPEGRQFIAHVWVVSVGRVPLLLLDACQERNEPELRSVTDRLYGGGTEHRLRQELLLGVGGVRALRSYCALTGHPEPEVFHMNEGHAGFLGLERVREYVDVEGLTFDQALELTRAGTVFTTHTPVPAGIDRFPRDLVEHHFTGTGAAASLPADRVMALGTETYEDGDPAVFNMAVMGMRLSQSVNGVSTLHGQVSREMFHGLWPDFDPIEVPITAVTNGVHARTWVAEEAQELADRMIDDVTELADIEGWRKITGASDRELWEMRRLLRERLIADARKRLRRSWKQRGATEAELGWIDDVLDPDILTVGFARRVPSYKRLTLMLRDRERLKSLLLHPERPIQIVIAGKAHPADEGGKRLIQEVVRFADDPEVRHRIVFLPDYDMALARAMVQGSDVWLNNPLRPLEACGTSGMKVALNGGLNLSVRDGWWDEWFDGSNGWAIPTADGVAEPDRRDSLEAAALYELIEEQVTGQFYDRDKAGLPKRWLEMVKHTLVSLGPKVLASRMVRDYVNELYRPAAVSARLLTRDGLAADRDFAAWKQRVRRAWPGVRIEHVEVVDMEEPPQAGGEITVRTTLVLGDLTPEDVRVEAVLGRVDEEESILSPTFSELSPVRGKTSQGPLTRYQGSIPLARAGRCGYTVRVVPKHPLLTNPAEMGLAVVPGPPPGMGDGMVLR